MALISGILTEFVTTFLPRAAGAVSAKLAADSILNLKFRMKLKRMLDLIDEDLLHLADSEGLNIGELESISSTLRDRLPAALASIENLDWSRQSINSVLSEEHKYIASAHQFTERDKYIYTEIFGQAISTIYTIASRAKNIGNEDIRVILDLLEHVAAKISSIEILTEKISNFASDKIIQRLRSVLSRKAIFESIDPYGVAPVSGQALDFSRFFIEPDLSSKGVARTAGEFFRDIAMTSNQRLLVYGGAGAGKTTLSSWFEKIGNTEFDNNIIVVRVPLRDVKGPDFFSIINVLEYRISKHVLSDVDRAVITRLVDTSSFLFIFDGFDEISIQNRDPFSDAIKDFSDFVSPSSVLITSRKLSTTHLSGITNSECQIMPLSRSQISTYIDKYASTHILKNQARDFHLLDKLIASNKKLTYLASNPLMLSTIATVYAIDGALAIDVYDLYKRFIDAMTFHWHSRKGASELHADIRPEVQRTVLAKLALRMMIENRDIVSREFAGDVATGTVELAQSHLTADDMLKVIYERSALIELGSEVQFVHKSICEFLAAECIWKGYYQDDAVEYNSLWLKNQLERSDNFNNVGIFWYKSVPYEIAVPFQEYLFNDGCYPKWLIIVLESWERLDEEMLRKFLSRLFELASSDDDKGIIRRIPHKIDLIAEYDDLEIIPIQLLTYSSFEEAIRHIRSEKDDLFNSIFGIERCQGYALKLYIRTCSLDGLRAAMQPVSKSANPHLWLEFGRRWATEFALPVTELDDRIFTFFFLISLAQQSGERDKFEEFPVIDRDDILEMELASTIGRIDLDTASIFVSGNRAFSQSGNMFSNYFLLYQDRHYSNRDSDNDGPSDYYITRLKRDKPRVFFEICKMLYDRAPGAVLNNFHARALDTVLKAPPQHPSH